MINLNKNKIEPFVAPIWLKTIAVVAFYVTAFGMGAGIPIYIAFFHVTPNAKAVVRNIEQHPEQWTTKSGVGYITYENKTIGISATNGATAKGGWALIRFYGEKRSTEPFRHAPNKRAIWQALQTRVGKAETRDEIIGGVIQKLESK